MTQPSYESPNNPKSWHSKGVDNYNITGNEYPTGADFYITTRQEELHDEEDDPKTPDPYIILKRKEKAKEKVKEASQSVRQALVKFS